jgi:hypothetical protein
LQITEKRKGLSAEDNRQGRGGGNRPYSLYYKLQWRETQYEKMDDFRINLGSRFAVYREPYGCKPRAECNCVCATDSGGDNCTDWMEAVEMTLEEKRIERLYGLMHKIEKQDPDMAAVLKWAIFELERKPA